MQLNVTFTHLPSYSRMKRPLYLLNRMLDEPHTWSRLFDEQDHCLFLSGIEAGFLEHIAHSLDTILTAK